MRGHRTAEETRFFRPRDAYLRIPGSGQGLEDDPENVVTARQLLGGCYSGQPTQYGTYGSAETAKDQELSLFAQPVTAVSGMNGINAMSGQPGVVNGMAPPAQMDNTGLLEVSDLPPQIGTLSSRFLTGFRS